GDGMCSHAWLTWYGTRSGLETVRGVQGRGGPRAERPAGIGARPHTGRRERRRPGSRGTPRPRHRATAAADADGPLSTLRSRAPNTPVGGPAAETCPWWSAAPAAGRRRVPRTP